ncbi:MAG: NUDIX domain-containing protein [Candidatus Paceibacterota bacterium]|jgi:8-oxo-dGTP diphosphatase
MDRKFGVATKAIIKKGKKFLVIFKSDTEEISPNEIDLPGGRLKFGEKLEDGLKREIKEELNITIKTIKLSRSWSMVKDDLHLVGLTFLVDYVAGEIKLSGEHTNFKWVNKEDIIKGKYPTWIKNEFEAIS